ncbi:MAG: DNA topoisomerase VI subunit B [Candidatus Thorarchaeota archaeon]|nr:DNA topoisomerase VI subunit B [Candidatus Thorarchaeota archaeon]
MNQKTPLETTFGSISPAEFFYRNRQMAGFGNSSQAVYSTIRELVENSLDSCEDAERYPDVHIRISCEESDILSVRVADNGTGVPAEYVPEAFGKILFGSKYHERQRRGTFGLGVTMAVLYGQITANSPVLIHTRSRNTSGTEYTLFIDVESNEPLIEATNLQEREYEGTTITLRIQGDLKRVQERIVEYLRLTAVSTPHSKISLDIDGSETIEFGRWSNEIPPLVLSSKPHPRAADLELLRRFMQRVGNKRLQDFLIDSFQKVGVKTSTRFLRFISFDPNQETNTLTRDDLSRISEALRKYDDFESPDPRSLSPIGKSPIIDGLNSTFNVSNIHYSIRPPSEWQGNPFIVEGAIVLSDDFARSEIPTLYRFANRVPLLYDSSEDVMTKALKRINWKRYTIGASSPAALFVHLCSTRIPYKAAGKQSIGTISEIENELLYLFKELGRRFNKGLRKEQRSVRESKKMREFARTFRNLVKFSADLADFEGIPKTSHLIQQLFEVASDE